MTQQELLARITSYLSCGGLINPEYANHDAVSELLIDCRDELASLQAQLDAEREAHEHTKTMLQGEHDAHIEDHAAREEAERELARINPLYTAACQDARDAEKRLAQIEGETFLEQLRRMNKERCEQNFKHAITSWNIMEWGCALAGEAGELCNVLKKVQRERDGIEGSRIEGDSTKAIADELADVIIYGDLLAELCGINLAEAIANKFNETSKKVGYNRALPRTAAPERELARINPLYTSACQDARDADKRLAQIEADRDDYEARYTSLQDAVAQCVKGDAFMTLHNEWKRRLSLQRTAAPQDTALKREEGVTQPDAGGNAVPAVAAPINRVAQEQFPVTPHQSSSGPGASLDSPNDAESVSLNEMGSGDKAAPVAAIAYGPEKQDYPGGPIYRVGTSKGIITGSQYATGLGEWAERRQGEKK